MDLFELVAKLTLDSSEYEKGLDDSEKKANGFGNAIGGAMKTGVAAFTATAAAAGTAGAALVKSTGDVASYGDNIDKMSQKMGLTAEAYQEWDAVMQHSGTSMETMKASMKTLANAAEKGNEAFATLGITEDQLASMNQQEIFEATIAGLQQVEDDTQRTYLAGQLLGRGATELGALLNTSAEETQAMRDRVHELGGVMSDEAVKASAKYQDTLQDMTTAFDGMKRGIISDFLPAVTEGMEGLTDIMGGDMDGGLEKLNSAFDSVISGVTEKLPKLVDAVSTVGMALVDAFLSNLPEFAKTGIEIITKLGQGIAEALPSLIDTLSQSFVGVLEALTDPDALTNLLSAGIMIIESLIQGILEALPMLIEALPTIIENIVQFFTSAIPMLINMAIEIMVAIVDALPEIIQALVDALPQIVESIISALLENIPLIIDAGIRLLFALINAIPKVVVALAEAIPQIVTGICDALIDNIDQIIEAGVTLFVALVEDLPTIIAKIVEAIPKIIVALVKAIVECVPKLLEAGAKLMAGLAKGIAKGALAPVNAMKDAGKKVVDKAKSLFGIHSPSKLFEFFGDMLDEGMAIGIEDNIDKVSQAMNAMQDATMPSDDIFGDDWSTSTQVISTGNTEASGGSQPINVILELDKVQLGKAVFALNNAETQRMGVNLANGGY